MKQSPKEKPYFNLYDKLEKCVNTRLLEALKTLRHKTQVLTVKIESKK